MTHKDSIIRFAEERGGHFKDLAKAIHAKPEVSNHEYFAQKALGEALEEEGFELKYGIGGHPTGFIASYKGDKAGPVIAFLAEYDALPGIGHACGHNLFGATSALAASALKQAVDEIGGEVRVYGTPGEEGGENGCAKANFANQGYFSDVDAALCAHPGSNTHQRSSESLACVPVEISFTGRASHAASAPEKGVNALDAVIQVFNSINALRQHLPSDVRIHGIITKGGDAPNIVPEFAQARFYLRAKALPTLKNVYAKVKKIVEGAALATGTSGSFKAYNPIIANTVLCPAFDELYRSKILELGERFDDSIRKSFGSSDVGNVSQLIPTIQPRVKISETPVEGHSIEKREACISQTGLDSVVVAGKALALTGLALLEDSEPLANIKREHRFQLEKQSNGTH